MLPFLGQRVTIRTLVLWQINVFLISIQNYGAGTLNHNKKKKKKKKKKKLWWPINDMHIKCIQEHNEKNCIEKNVCVRSIL